MQLVEQARRPTKFVSETSSAEIISGCLIIITANIDNDAHPYKFRFFYIIMYILLPIRPEKVQLPNIIHF